MLGALQPCMKKTLSVIIPVFNEKNTIVQLLERVKKADSGDYDKEIIVVDDCSTDGTRDFIAKLKGVKGVKVVFHQRNLGKGGAVRTGLQHATGDLILLQDADTEYDPNDYSRLVQPIVEGKADVVYGSRFAGKSLQALGGGRVILPIHFIGNKVLTIITNLFYGQRLTDMETGYKVFKSSIIKNLNFKANRFDMEPEITARLIKRGIKIFEVPISYTARDFRQGKKITWKDGVKAAWCLIKYRFAD